MAAAYCGRVVSFGSDAGIVDYAGTVDVLRSHAPRQVLDRIGQG
jgi:hypothetical protein